MHSEFEPFTKQSSVSRMFGMKPTEATPRRSRIVRVGIVGSFEIVNTSELEHVLIVS